MTVNPWKDLTDRHKKYAVMLLLLGALVGGMAGLIIALCLGLGFTMFGISIISSKKEWTDDAGRKTWMAIGIGALFTGVALFVGAIIGLTLHQNGVI